MDTSKPDLMAASRRVAESKRILAQLEHGPRAPAHPARASAWSIDGWTIGLLALLLLMCCVAWLMHDKKITPQTFRHASAARTARGTVTQARPAATGVAEQPAAIINLPALQENRAVPASAPTPSAMTAAVANLASAARQASRVAHKPAAKPATVPAAPAQANGDTDITLLTALVAHTRTAPADEPPAPPAVGRRTAN
ncbi:hypothetical protein KW842_07150 [Duganella sp. sic0402]|uniref:hypothetical protein n=1 Tax=Duganella sp. sic0402 TaxID=2854786 RepID=UPI001C438FBE|nr:hypothetical protein [Duganella sp. sic0402]MBV7535538.1 hypothetical protein [Duganella sp. sic0402]